MKRALGVTRLLIARWLHLSYTREPIRYRLGMAPLAVLILGTPLPSEVPYGSMQFWGEVSLWRR